MTIRTLVLLAAVLSMTVWTLKTMAQEDDMRQGPPGGRGGLRAPPIEAALDVNGDGALDESEIAQASEALKKLDANGDGKLSSDELRPPRPSR